LRRHIPGSKSVRSLAVKRAVGIWEGHVMVYQLSWMSQKLSCKDIQVTGFLTCVKCILN